jgi:hypothetical protein
MRTPVPPRISGAQLLTKASFADLRSCKFFRCVRLVGAVGVEFASLHSKSRRGNGVAPPPLFNWSLLEPSRSATSAWRDHGERRSSVWVSSNTALVAHLDSRVNPTIEVVDPKSRRRHNEGRDRLLYAIRPGKCVSSASEL